MERKKKSGNWDIDFLQVILKYFFNRVSLKIMERGNIPRGVKRM